uniref:HTH cro/C1-type domain-containing protein n=1 Tax=Thermosporothrix sp. COM3 TaxID=2490863 RepID=A0A455SI51_9CHLR|nr:hypothetical protein KTC_19910 [Thermosporothrix sp. COM3]
MLKHRADIADHETQPLSTKAVQQAQVTRYLDQHQLSLHAIARAAGTPLMVVWRVQHGKPVTEEHARTIESAFLCLTGMPYEGSFAVYPEESQGTR